MVNLTCPLHFPNYFCLFLAAQSVAVSPPVTPLFVFSVLAFNLIVAFCFITLAHLPVPVWGHYHM